MKPSPVVGFWGPARLTATGFILLILAGTVALMLPFAAHGQTWTPLMPAVFTATSAVSLTGLVVEDTATYWTPFGQVVILILIQLGGLGIMSVASLSGMVITGRISLRARGRGAAEGRPISAGGIRRSLVFTLAFTLIAEGVVAFILWLRFWLGYGHTPLRAAWEGVFHAVSAFNNAGFSTQSDNAVPFAADAWVLLPLAVAFIGGGLGYPVWSEAASWLRHGAWRTQVWSLTAKFTFFATATLLTIGALFFAICEWNGVLARMPLGQKLLNAFFAGASPRTAGFNAIDYADAQPITLMGTDVLMFIGGGSAGTAGGIKVTTACVLFAAMASEFRGWEETSVGKRSLPSSVSRQALALTFAGASVVTLGVGVLRVFDPQFSADQVVFEVMSAFATVGLSTGITGALSVPSQIVLCFIMYLGRIGPVTLVTALALSGAHRRFSYPEERPFIG